MSFYDIKGRGRAKYETVPVGSETLPSPIEKTQKITLTHDQSIFTIGFAGLNYQASSKNLYQYKLDGFEKDWSPPLTKHEATYTNISPGKYTFMVRAANNDGAWNVIPAKTEIEILPPWWGTWWFRTLAVLVVAAVILGGVQWRISSIRARNRELEKRVNGRTKELLDAQERLRIANEELQKQLDEITKLEQQVREQAIRDALTGLYNRHHLLDVLEAEFCRAERKGHPIAFMLIDLDHFKEVNDVYGHQAGDLALQAATQTISSLTRRSDIAFRYGGEEFVILLPQTPLEGALQVAETVRQQVEGLGLKHAASDVKPVVTLSLGVASLIPALDGDGDRLIKAADEALYHAKKTGRNRALAARDCNRPMNSPGNGPR